MRARARDGLREFGVVIAGQRIDRQRALPCAFPGQDDSGGLDHYLEIEPQRPMLDIAKDRVRHARAPFLKRFDLAAEPIDLGPTDDPRIDPVAMLMPLDRLAVQALANVHLDRMRAGADQRHIAAPTTDPRTERSDGQSHNPRRAPCSRRLVEGQLTKNATHTMFPTCSR